MEVVVTTLIEKGVPQKQDENVYIKTDSISDKED
jgi:hypothetical protein